jgi:hypothetical protein
MVAHPARRLLLSLEGQGLDIHLERRTVRDRASEWHDILMLLMELIAKKMEYTDDKTVIACRRVGHILGYKTNHKLRCTELA